MLFAGVRVRLRFYSVMSGSSVIALCQAFSILLCYVLPGSLDRAGFCCHHRLIFFFFLLACSAASLGYIRQREPRKLTNILFIES